MPTSNMATAAVSEDREIVEHFLRLALLAGNAVMEVYRRGAVAGQKADRTPVTEADHRSEQLILSGLRSAFPGIPCVAEEEVAAGVVPPRLGDVFFLVDPLDGTREFVAGGTDFTVNIALIRAGVPELGVVYAPCGGRIFAARPGYAESGEVASDGRIAGRRSIKVRQAAAPLTIVASRSHRTPETDAYLARFKNASIASIGSSLKFCLLACGEADLYPRFGRTMEWDTAAGDAVLRAAGGMTTTLDGSPLAYGRRGREGEADFANPDFIARGGVDEATALSP